MRKTSLSQGRHKLGKVSQATSRRRNRKTRKGKVNPPGGNQGGPAGNQVKEKKEKGPACPDFPGGGEKIRRRCFIPATKRREKSGPTLGARREESSISLRWAGGKFMNRREGGA